MCCEDHGLYFIHVLQSCRDILSLVFQIFHNIPTTPDAALTDRIQACVKVYFFVLHSKHCYLSVAWWVIKLLHFFLLQTFTKPVYDIVRMP